MTITSQSLIPAKQSVQIATGTVLAMVDAAASVELDGGTLVTASVVGGVTYISGQRVIVAIPGGILSSAVITGLATGSATAAQQVHVPFAE